MNGFTKFYEIETGEKGSYIDNLVQRMQREIWDSQDDIVYHDDNHKYPVLAEDAYEIIEQIFNDEVHNLRHAIVMGFLDHIYRDIVDPGENRYALEHYFGWDYPDWANDLPNEVYFEHGDEKQTRPAFLPF